MKRLPDDFPLMLFGATGLLALALHSIFEDLLKSIVLRLFAGALNATEAEVISRLTELAVPIVAAVAIILFVYRYIDKSLRSERAIPFLIGQHLICESSPINITDSEIDPNLYRNRYFVAIGNGLENGTTLRRVRATILGFADVAIAPIKGSNEAFSDLRHEEWLYFHIGSVVTEKAEGSFSFNKTTSLSNAAAAGYKHNLFQRHISFEVENFDGTKAFGLGSGSGPIIWPLAIQISAEDVRSGSFNANIDMTDIELIKITFTDIA